MKQLKPRRVGAGDEEAAAGVVVPLTPHKDYCCWSWSSWCLLRALTLLLVLLTGVLVGFGASANISRYYYYTLLTGTGTGTSSSSPPSLISSNSPTPPSTLAMSSEQHISQPFMSFVHPGSPEGHSMTDAELFWRASMVPRVEEYPYQRVPKVAFLFLTRGPLPFARLWERFFRGHEGLYSVYVHALPEYVLNVSATSPFYGRQIPSRDVSWGSITLVTEFFDYDYHRIYTQRL